MNARSVAFLFFLQRKLSHQHNRFSFSASDQATKILALDAEEGVFKTFYAMLVWKLNILNCMYKLISAFDAQKTSFAFIITPIEPKISPVIMLYKHSTMLAVKLQITVSQWQCHYATCICAIETGKKRALPWISL